MTDREAFNNKLDFEISLIAYQGDNSWVDDAIKGLYACLQSDQMRKQGMILSFVNIREAVGER